MITFEATLSETWQEILNGGTSIAIDVSAASSIDVHFSETGTTPAADATAIVVQSWSSAWDFQANDMPAGVQRIWVKGAGKIIGVRG